MTPLQVSAIKAPRCRTAGVLLLLGAAAPAAGQGVPAADTATTRDTARTLEPVRVTVLRTPLELASAPYAVTVLRTAELQRGRQGFNLAEGLVAVPGVQVDNRYNFALGERISVRGFGARAQFGVRGVRVLVDGIPATMPDGQTTLNHVDIANLGRAEVVRGPASAIYGNSSGGVLQLETEPPPAAPIAQRVRVVGGSDDLRRIQSTTSGFAQTGAVPLGYALNLSRLTYGGYRGWSDAENNYAALKLSAGGSRTSVRLAAHLADYSGNNPGSLSDSLLRVDRTRAFRDNEVRWRAGEEGRHLQVGAAARQRLGPGEMELSVYSLGRELDNPIPQRVVVLERQAEGGRLAFGAPLRLGGLPVQLVAGAQADRQRDDRLNFVNDTGRRGPLRLSQLERVTSTAGFAQVAVEAAARLSVLGALRYDRTRFAARDRYVTATDPDDSGERTLDATSPSVGVNWRLGVGSSVYANFATAFETPTTTELANRPSGAGGFNPELEPQRTRSFEAGGTARLGTLGTAQLAVYEARVSDYIISFEVPDFPGRSFFRNAGSTEHRGVEAGVSVLAGSRGAVRAAYTYTDARFEESDTVAYAGERIPGVAPHRADLVASYTLGDVLWVEVEERYVSATPTNDVNAAGTDSPPYALTNARARLDLPALRRLDAAPFVGVSNVFDRSYNSSVVVNAFGRRYYEPGPGRTVYVGLELAAGAPSRLR